MEETEEAGAAGADSFLGSSDGTPDATVDGGGPDGSADEEGEGAA